MECLLSFGAESFVFHFGIQKYKIKVHKTIMPVVLYGYKTWLLTLREESSLRVFEDRVLRRIFGPKRDEVRWAWWRLRNEELNDLYTSPNIIRVINSRRMGWAGHVARIGERRGVYRVLVGKLRKRDHLEDPCLDGRIRMWWIVR